MKITCMRCKRQFDPAEYMRDCPHARLPIGHELDKALDEFVADKPKDIMR